MRGAPSKRPPARVRGATLGDMIVFLAVLSLAAALLYPAWSARSFRAEVARAMDDIQAVAGAARFEREANGRWPTPAVAGTAPPELAALEARDSLFSRRGYALGWTAWEVVDSVEAIDTDPPSVDAPPATVGPVMEPVVRTMGGVTVHSGNEALIAELLQRHGDQDAFVLDTQLLLILPERTAAAAGR